MSIGDTILQRASDAYRRFRNTFRFLLGSLSDFDSAKYAVDASQMPAIDKWALLRLREVLANVEKGYDEYRFHQVFRTLYEYVINDLSAIYMDVAKDRLYSEAPDSPARRSAQTVLYEILEVMVRVLSPVLSFTCDEVWEHYPDAERNRDGRPFSVQLAGWPSAERIAAGISDDEAAQLMKRFEVLLTTRDAVTKALEDARNAKVFGKSQEAALTIVASESDAAVLASFDEADLKELFIVASVAVEAGDAADGEPSVSVKKTELPRCPRCWNYLELGGNAAHPDVCKRCGDALDAIGFAEPQE